MPYKHSDNKLRIMLLAEMVNDDEGSINSRIASYLLGHLDEVREASLRDLAAKMYVSISRFCRDIGLRDFSELRSLLETYASAPKPYSLAATPQAQRDDYVSGVQESLELVRRSVDMDKIYELAADILRYERVAVFGPLKAAAVAMNLQADLAELGKPAVCKVRFSQQWDYLSGADENDLVILFSFLGIYFDYGIPADYRKDARHSPKVWFITSGPGEDMPAYYDEVIRFESAHHGQVDHPFQLQLIANLIGHCCLRLLQ